LLNVGQLRAIKFFDFLPVNGQRTRTNCGVRRRLKIAHYAAIEARRKSEEEAKKKKIRRKKNYNFLLRVLKKFLENFFIISIKLF